MLEEIMRFGQGFVMVIDLSSDQRNDLYWLSKGLYREVLVGSLAKIRWNMTSFISV
jgi:hypothetical protein